MGTRNPKAVTHLFVVFFSNPMVRSSVVRLWGAYLRRATITGDHSKIGPDVVGIKKVNIPR